MGVSDNGSDRDGRAGPDSGPHSHQGTPTHRDEAGGDADWSRRWTEAGHEVPLPVTQ